MTSKIHTACCTADYWMDGRTEQSLRFGHGPPTRFDPLEPTKEPRWYEVRHMHRGLLDACLLPPGTDLKRIFVAAMLEWIDAGWTLGEFRSISGHFFCTRGAERRMVPITPSDPGRVAKF